MKITANELLKKHKHIENWQLRKAVSMALWLTVEKGRPFASSVKSASNSCGYKPKTHIERAARERLPVDFLYSRSKPVSTAISHRRRVIDGIDNAASSHMESI